VQWESRKGFSCTPFLCLMPLQSIAETVEGAENGSEYFEEGGSGNRDGKACGKNRKQEARTGKAIAHQ